MSLRQNVSESGHPCEKPLREIEGPRNQCRTLNTISTSKSLTRCFYNSAEASGDTPSLQVPQYSIVKVRWITIL